MRKAAVGSGSKNAICGVMGLFTEDTVLKQLKLAPFGTASLIFVPPAWTPTFSFPQCMMVIIGPSMPPGRWAWSPLAEPVPAGQRDVELA